MPDALIVDDDDEHNSLLADALRAHAIDVHCARSVAEAREEAASRRFVVAFINLRCGEVNGLNLLEDSVLDDANEIILMNEVDEPELVTRGIGLGATYFFCKPFDSEFIDTLLTDLVAELAAEELIDDPSCQIDQFGLLRGGSPPMRRLYRTMRKVASSEASVLLVGESGTGKELVARSLHMLSDRAESQFVAVNCAAVPEDLFESELFGHEKGSFSGAVRQHQGYFERAKGGTLFLDEITEMPPDLQAKLLRVLEVGRFHRVGGEGDIDSDARIIAATNRNPEAAIADGNLREDFYYRIARFPLRVPPLRDRGSDIAGLAQFFLNELNSANESGIGISDAALAAIEAYDWPGNVRELRSVLERAFILANDEIGPDHLGSLEKSGVTDADYIRVPVTASVDEAQKQLIFAALESHDGDKRAAAKSLGISLKTLYNRLNDYAER